MFSTRMKLPLVLLFIVVISGCNEPASVQDHSSDAMHAIDILGEVFDIAVYNEDINPTNFESLHNFIEAVEKHASKTTNKHLLSLISKIELSQGTVEIDGREFHWIRSGEEHDLSNEGSKWIVHYVISDKEDRNAIKRSVDIPISN